jgi:transposase-like protein
MNQNPYCPNCKRGGIFRRLQDIYLDRFICDSCGKEYNLIDIENEDR